jgi:hypothetical protein
VNFDKAFNILGAVLVVAGIAVVVGSKQTGGIIKAFGGSFSSVIDSAQTTGGSGGGHHRKHG